jgi:hypothetical protein
MAQELLRYQPTADGHEGWCTRIAELIAIANEDPALGGAQGAGEPDPVAGHRAPGAGDGKAAQAKKAVSRAASSLPVRNLMLPIANPMVDSGCIATTGGSPLFPFKTMSLMVPTMSLT